jgi:hypothetical protein
MRRPQLLLALILLLVGLVWIGQGTGIIAGRAMSGSAFWAAVGLILVGVAVAIFVREGRRPTRR